MPQAFEQIIRKRNIPAENVAIMREAYLFALDKLGIADAPPEDRLALIEIIQQLANVEIFRQPDRLGALAIEWYRSKQAAYST